jgi:hypothetical protein
VRKRATCSCFVCYSESLKPIRHYKRQDDGERDDTGLSSGLLRPICRENEVQKHNELKQEAKMSTMVELDPVVGIVAAIGVYLAGKAAIHLYKTFLRPGKNLKTLGKWAVVTGATGKSFNVFRGLFTLD